MRKVILIITVLIFTALNSKAQGWVQQSSGTFCDLNSVFFTDFNTGYAVGDSGIARGVILKTSDGGLNWVRQVNTSVGIVSVYFIDANTGYACGNISGGHSFYKTTNGGLNWNVSFYSDQNSVYCVYFINSSTGFLCGQRPASKLVSGIILRTTDGGVNWVQQVLFFPASYTTIFFTDVLTGYTGGSSPMFKTTNSGTTWFQVSGPYANSIYFINSLTGYTAGGSNIYKTTTGGNNWSSIFYYQSCTSLMSVFFANDQTGWECGCLGNINSTTNGGNNWFLQSSGSTTMLNSLSFISSQTGWAVGDFGRILKTTNGGVTLLQPISSIIPKQYSLSKNYPNPFNPTTNFEFSIPLSRGVSEGRGVYVNLTIYDVMGREIETLQNGEMKPGTYEVNWNASSYPSGVYFYKLSTGSFTETKKMILVK